MPSQWDARADRDLLLAIIDEGALKSVLWPKIAEKMQNKGYTFTHEACRYATTLFTSHNFHHPPLTALLTFNQHH